MDFRAGVDQAFAELGPVSDVQAFVIDDDEERRSVETAQIFFGEELFFRAHVFKTLKRWSVNQWTNSFMSRRTGGLMVVEMVAL